MSRHALSQDRASRQSYRRRDEFIKTLHAHQDFPAAAQSVNHARRLIYKNLRLTATGEEQLASTTY